MVKVKNKKNFGLADKLHAKKTQSKTKRNLNPFEVHINKEKFKVLGKKSKNDWGLPGVSRAKAMKKRKNTIGHELKLMNKTNTFIDKRIGEKNVALSAEDKIMARFAAERVQQHKMKSEKQSIYNLAEEEILTHRGQTLEEIEKFDDPRSDDEEDEEMERRKSGNLADGFVSDANFGGGILSRNENKDGAISRKDLIEQLIIESKKRKMEKQKLKEETLDLTEKLDSEWKDLQPVVAKDFNKEVEKLKAAEPVSIIDKVLSNYEKKNEAYDKMMRELKFEPRGTPSDRLKSEDEIAKTEKDKLEKLEQDRLARMHGTAEIKNGAPKHRSADDLDDGFEVDSDPETMITYDSEGKVVITGNAEQDDDDQNNESGSEDEDGDKDGNNESVDGEENASSSDESEDSLCDLREMDEESEKSDEDIDEKQMELNKITPKRSIESEIRDSKKHKKDDGPESIEISKKNDNVLLGKKKGLKEIVTNNLSLKKNENLHNNTKADAVKESVQNGAVDSSAADKIKADLLARKAMMEKAAAELPYTFGMPENYDILQELLEKHPPDYQFLIVERIIKCNHPKLGEANKAKLSTLFAYLLQYLNDLFCADVVTSEESILNSFKCFDRLTSHIYDLAQMDPTNAKNCIVEVIKEKYEEFKKKPNVFPDLDTLIFFKLVSLLFPTSDLKHPVVTPCFLFMSHILNNCKVRNNNDVARGLFVTTLVLEYTVLSKRILPAAINFIRGVIFLCVYTPLDHQIKVLRPFKALGPKSNLLVVQDNVRELDDVKEWNMDAHHLIGKNEDDKFKIKVLATAIRIFDDFFRQADDLTIQGTLFEEHIKLLQKISANNYPKCVRTLLKKVLDNAEETLKNKTYQPLVEERKKPKTLKLYEPAVEKEFSGRKKKQISREKTEHEKLVYKHKKEMKGALREIRRDKSFISAVKIKEKITSDNIRKQKVKQIYSEASMQQGELNALQRSKKKKK